MNYSHYRILLCASHYISIINYDVASSFNVFSEYVSIINHDVASSFNVFSEYDYVSQLDILLV